MECNKDEAVKARTVAEKKLMLEDYIGARRFILKAQRLDPNLVGLHHFMAVLDVQSTAQEVSGEFASSWHKILQVSHLTDEETVRKQYKKLILLLHPDKNKFPGASAAFKIVKDAFHFFEKERDSSIKAVSGSNGAESQPKEGYFWTRCTKCKAPSELLLSLESQFVQCRHCLQPFLASNFVAAQRKCSQKDCQDAEGNVGETECHDGKKQADGKVESGGGDNWANERSTPSNREKPQDPEDAPDGGNRKNAMPPGCERGSMQERNTQANDGNYPADTKSVRFRSDGKKVRPHTRSASSINVSFWADQESAQTGDQEDLADWKSPLPDGGEDRPHGKCSPSTGGVKLGIVEESSPADQGKNVTHIESGCAKGPSHLMKGIPSDDGEEIVDQRNAPFDDGLTKLTSRKKPEHEADNPRGIGNNPVESTQNDHLTQRHPHEVISGDLHTQVKFDKKAAGKKRNRDCIDNDSSSSVESLGKKVKKLPIKCKLDLGTDSVVEKGKRSKSGKDDSSTIRGSSVEKDLSQKDATHKEPMKTSQIHNVKDLVQTMKSAAFQKLKMHILKGFNPDGLKVIDVKENSNISGSEHMEACSSTMASSQERILLNISVIFEQSSTATLGAKDTRKGSPEGTNEEDVDYIVPESDIYDFDKDRRPEIFEDGQIWAVYDDDDGFPRFYAYILKVVSIQPFSVLLKWLYPSEPITRDARKWLKLGLAYTCGEFELREVIKRNSTQVFSHLVAYEMGRKPNTFKIYPQKGDVWAVYSKWKPQPDTTCDCHPVLVVSPFNEKTGIVVAPLYRLEGYKSVFYVKEEEDVQCIPSREVTRFSHQIPAHHLGGGNDALGLPDNCFDLDTAAMFSS